MAISDYYVTLGVERTASDAEIKKAYRRLAQQWHPDVSPDPEAALRFKEISEAYQVLSDPERRQRYDLFGTAGSEAGAGLPRRGGRPLPPLLLPPPPRPGRRPPPPRPRPRPPPPP